MQKIYSWKQTCKKIYQSIINQPYTVYYLWCIATIKKLKISLIDLISLNFYYKV
jgi:hypothetical protein